MLETTEAMHAKSNANIQAIKAELKKVQDTSISPLEDANREI